MAVIAMSNRPEYRSMPLSPSTKMSLLRINMTLQTSFPLASIGVGLG